MPKHEPMGPKAIANRMKAKGLQKLRWYCQMCQKQCRDQNGFKCHLTSESHQRQLLLFAENPGTYMGEFSGEFERGFLDILRRQHGTKRVHANMIYQDYIKDRNHIHMNGTKWYSLTGFVRYLGRAGICKIDHTEKGWFIQYVDREEEERKEKMAKKQKMDKDDEERIQDLVMRQAERAREQINEQNDDTDEASKFTELQKPEDQKIEFQLPKIIVQKDAPLLVKPKKDWDEASTVSTSSSSSSNKKASTSRQKTALDEIREMEEKRKEMANRKDHWLHTGIVVKIVTKRLGDKYYKSKGIVEELVDEYTCMVRLLDSATGKKTGDLLKLDQAHLETVIPAIGKPLLVVNGAYRGKKAIMEKLDAEKFSVTVRIDEGLLKGRVVDNVRYEDVSKLHAE